MRKRHRVRRVGDLPARRRRAARLYKYELLGPNGELLPLKADPFGFEQELPPATASRVRGLPAIHWGDDGVDGSAPRPPTRSRRRSRSTRCISARGGGRRRRFLDYDELAETLIPYVNDMGFTHIELLPITEHPFDGSWGYQPIGLFAPTAASARPRPSPASSSAAMRPGIGVIIDWVPAHFPTDAHGLARFDGTALYEHDDPRQGFHRDWNTLIYNFGRREVREFPRRQRAATGWSASRRRRSASMPSPRCSTSTIRRPPGEWVPNVHGGRENLEAIAFLRELNTGSIADRSRRDDDRRGIDRLAARVASGPLGGLGFGYKWNMGWMHDTLDYMSRDPVHRRYHHDQLTFGLLYAFTRELHPAALA